VTATVFIVRHTARRVAARGAGGCGVDRRRSVRVPARNYAYLYV